MVREDIPDHFLYRPTFHPWLIENSDFRILYDKWSHATLVSADRCYVLYTALVNGIQIEGDVWECGVYKGGTASLMSEVIRAKNRSKNLYLFDTFDGMPTTDPEKDVHNKGDFRYNYESELDEVGIVRKGFIPDTFSGLESSVISFAHVDVDIYKSVMDSISFIWPRLSFGGIIICDDYGFATCPGARAAIDEYFSFTKCVPLCLPTGQALMFKAQHE